MDEKELNKELVAQFFSGTIKEERRQNQLLAPLHINYDTYRCLRYLYEHPDGVEPSRMADELLILRQTITSIVDNLQKRGYVERHPHPTDRRRIIIQLLPPGIEITKQALKISEEYHRRITAHFTEKELVDYIQIRKRVVETRDEVLAQMLAERSEKEL